MWRECARQCCGQETCCINQDIEAICRQAAILESGGPKGLRMTVTALGFAASAPRTAFLLNPVRSCERRISCRAVARP